MERRPPCVMWERLVSTTSSALETARVSTTRVNAPETGWGRRVRRALKIGQEKPAMCAVEDGKAMPVMSARRKGVERIATNVQVAGKGPHVTFVHPIGAVRTARNAQVAGRVRIAQSVLETGPERIATNVQVAGKGPNVEFVHPIGAEKIAMFAVEVGRVILAISALPIGVVRTATHVAPIGVVRTAMSAVEPGRVLSATSVLKIGLGRIVTCALKDGLAKSAKFLPVSQHAQEKSAGTMDVGGVAEHAPSLSIAIMPRVHAKRVASQTVEGSNVGPTVAAIRVVSARAGHVRTTSVYAFHSAMERHAALMDVAVYVEYARLPRNVMLLETA